MTRAALGAAAAIEAVEDAKELAYGNVNPQLLTPRPLAPSTSPPPS